MRIEIVVFDGVEELDALGPFEVWKYANDVDVALVGLDGPGEVTGRGGLRFRAQAGLGEPDALFVPGGGWLNRAPQGAWAEAQQGRLPARIAELAPELNWVGSVCTGGMLLAEAGLLKGRTATTNRSAWSALEAYGVKVLTNRVVDDGDVVTAGGIACGIDAALHLLARDYGKDESDRVAAVLEYQFTNDVHITAAAG